jgi:hypothetical protein
MIPNLTEELVNELHEDLLKDTSLSQLKKSVLRICGIKLNDEEAVVMLRLIHNKLKSKGLKACYWQH